MEHSLLIGGHKYVLWFQGKSKFCMVDVVDFHILQYDTDYALLQVRFQLNILGSCESQWQCYIWPKLIQYYLTDWLTEWLTDWPTDWIIFSSSIMLKTISKPQFSVSPLFLCWGLERFLITQESALNHWGPVLATYTDPKFWKSFWTFILYNFFAMRIICSVLYKSIHNLICSC